MRLFAFGPGNEPPPPVSTADEAGIRERYIAARFPGLVRGAVDLRSTHRVLDVARALAEENELGLADELFDLAIEENGGGKELRLAQIEVAFVRRDAARFAALERALLAAFPDCAERGEVERLRHALGAAAGAADYEHEWPDLPCWLDTRYDLASEVMASELHHAMARRERAFARWVP